MVVFGFFDGTHTFNVLICIHCNGGANSSGIKYTGIFDKNDGFGKTRLYFFTSCGDIEIMSNAFTCKIDIKNASHQPIPFLLCWLRILNSRYTDIFASMMFERKKININFFTFPGFQELQ